MQCQCCTRSRHLAAAREARAALEILLCSSPGNGLTSDWTRCIDVALQPERALHDRHGMPSKLDPTSLLLPLDLELSLPAAALPRRERRRAATRRRLDALEPGRRRREVVGRENAVRRAGLRRAKRSGGLARTASRREGRTTGSSGMSSAPSKTREYTACCGKWTYEAWEKTMYRLEAACERRETVSRARTCF